MERKLAIDVANAITSFEAALHYFELKTKLYHIIFRGKGLEFDRFRVYTPDDDASLIDWKASMRAQKTLVRQYKEERDQKIVFIIDVSDSMIFGSGKKLKCEYAAEMVLALAHLIITSGDKAGLVMFGNNLVYEVRPQAGIKHLSLLIDTLSKAEFYGDTPNLNKALEYVADYLPESLSAVFIVSDFLHTNNDFERNMQLVAKKFETIALMIKDPRDMQLPDTALEVTISDPVSGRQLVVNPKVAKQHYEYLAKKYEHKVLQQFQRVGVDTLKIMTDEEFAFPLAREDIS